jgi:hypothetical protein
VRPWRFRNVSYATLREFTPGRYKFSPFEHRITVDRSTAVPNLSPDETVQADLLRPRRGNLSQNGAQNYTLSRVDVISARTFVIKHPGVLV